MTKRTVEVASAEELASDGDRLDTPGWYHLVVVKVIDAYLPDGETLIKNGGFSAMFRVICGEHEGKTVGLTFNDPNYSHKDQGAFARRKQNAFLIAANVMPPSPQAGQAEIELDNAIDMQVVAELELGKPKEEGGRRYMDLRFANIFHVDDPRAAEVMKCDNMLATIAAEHRHGADYFEPILGKKNVPAPGVSQPAAAAASQADFGGL